MDYQDDSDLEGSSPSAEDMKQMMIEKAHELFSICDVEEKGFITKRDMQRLQKELPLNPEQLEAVFDSLDDDKNNFLTLEEFTEGFGSFLGMPMNSEKKNLSRSGTVTETMPEKVYEDETDVLNDEEQFSDLLQNIDANCVVEDFDIVKNLWMNLKKEAPELCVNFEDFLYRMSNQMKQKVSDYQNLENILRTKSTAHDEEVRRLYEEMENQIKTEKERILKEEKLKEKQVRDEMENEILEKDRQLQDLLMKHSEMQERLQILNSEDLETKQENEKLLQEKEELEEKLIISDEQLDESRSYINQLRAQQRKEKQERAMAALQINEGIALERESLVKQLDLLRDMNRKLRDNQDEEALRRDTLQQEMIEAGGERLIYQRSEGMEMDPDAVRQNGSSPYQNASGNEEEPTDSQSSAATNRKVFRQKRQGSVLSNYFEAPSLHSKLGSCFESDEEVECDELPYDHSLSQISEASSGGRKLVSSTSISERGQPVGAYSSVENQERLQSGESMAAVQNVNEPERVFKVVFVGDSGVGKSSFIHRYCQGIFKDTFSATIGVDFRVKQLYVDGHPVVLQLWDTAGQERYRSITKQYFRKADGVLVMFDIMNESSFLNIRNWMESVKEGADEAAVIVLVGNKLDLVENEASKVVKYKEGSRVADEYEALFYETSAKSGESINDTFLGMARLLLEREDKQIEKALDLSGSMQKNKGCCGATK